MPLDEVLGQVTPDYLESLRRTDTLGSEDFSEAVDAYLFVREVASAASITDARYLQPAALQSMESFLTEIRDTTAPQVQAFSWSDEGAAATRQQVTSRANEMRDFARDQVAPYIQHAEVDSAKAAADASQIAKSLQEAEGVLSKLRQASGEAGSTQLSGYYRTETGRFRKQGYWLLGGTAAAAGSSRRTGSGRSLSRRLSACSQTAARRFRRAKRSCIPAVAFVLT